MTRTYRELLTASDAAGERQDCTVRAIAAALDLDYQEVHQALAARGRKPRKGCYSHQWLGAVSDLGWTYADILPLTGGKVKTVITARKWLEKHTDYRTIVLIDMTEHLATWRHSAIHDSTRKANSRTRIDHLYLLQEKAHTDPSFTLE